MHYYSKNLTKITRNKIYTNLTIYFFQIFDVKLGLCTKTRALCLKWLMSIFLLYKKQAEGVGGLTEARGEEHENGASMTKNACGGVD